MSIEPQLGFTRFLVRAVTLEAILGKDRQHVATKVERRIRRLGLTLARSRGRGHDRQDSNDGLTFHDAFSALMLTISVQDRDLEASPTTPPGLFGRTVKVRSGAFDWQLSIR